MQTIQSLVSKQSDIQKHIRSKFGVPKSGLLRIFNHTTYDLLCPKTVSDVSRHIVNRNLFLLDTIELGLETGSETEPSLKPKSKTLDDYIHKYIHEYNYCSNLEVAWIRDSDRIPKRLRCIDQLDFETTMGKILEACDLKIHHLSDNMYVLIQLRFVFIIAVDRLRTTHVYDQRSSKNGWVRKVYSRRHRSICNLLLQREDVFISTFVGQYQRPQPSFSSKHSSFYAFRVLYLILFFMIILFCIIKK